MEPKVTEPKTGETEAAPTPDVEKFIEAPPAQRMDLYESVAAQLDAEKIEAWLPEKGDVPTLTTDLLGIELAVTVNGATCPIVYTVNSREVGQRRVWCWHTVLLREAIEAAPQIGDVVGFAYTGRSKSASGREYVGYSVAVARDSDSGPAEIDYNRLALEAGPPSADEEPRVSDAGDGTTKPPDKSTGGMLPPNDDLPFAPSVV